MSSSLLPIVVLVVALPVLIFEVAMFVDMLKNERLTDQQRMLWAAGMLLLHPFVAIYYYFTERNR
ncbi:MAG TPA: hypothetical protein VLH86_04110 [Patescibacteria group bacterium]|nr:hypothetical protein [Patescibacteria group bacterium]